MRISTVAFAFFLGALAHVELVHAGSANALLKCQSEGAPKGLKIEGEIPGDHAEFDLTVTHNGKSVNVADVGDGKDRAYVVESWKSGVFTLVVDGENPLHQLMVYAIPSTVVVTPISNGQKVKFTAIGMELSIPGYQGEVMWGAFFHNVRLNCTWEYSI